MVLTPGLFITNGSSMYTTATPPPNISTATSFTSSHHSTNGSHFKGAPEYPIAFWAFLAAESLLIILGNGMLCWLFCNRRQLRTQQNYFVMSLSVSDFLVGLTIAPCEYCAITRHNATNQDCILFCGSVLSFNMLASTFNLVLIAADRYFSIMRPFQYQELFSKTRARIVIVVSWMCTLIFVVLPFSWILNNSMDVLTIHRVNLIYGISLFSLVFLIGLLLGLAYFKIVRTIQSKMKDFKGAPSSTTGIKVCIMVAISFFLCWIPTCITELIIEDQQVYPSQIWMNTTYFILLMNPCLDPIMYAYYRRDFRKEVAQWRQRRWKSAKKLYDRLFLTTKERERVRLNNNFEVNRTRKQMSRTSTSTSAVLTTDLNSEFGS